MGGVRTWVANQVRRAGWDVALGAPARAALAVSVLAVGASLLGGCGGDLKQKNAMLASENQMLQQEKANLQTSLDQAEARRAELEGQLATLQQQRATPSGWDSGPADRDEPRASRSAASEDRAETITVAGDVAFSPGSDTVTAAGRRELQQIAATIKRRYPRNRIRVEGYTDSDPIRKSKWRSNEALSEARAAAVKKVLVSQGVSSARIETVGMGSASPKRTKAASRRVEIIVLR